MTGQELLTSNMMVRVHAIGVGAGWLIVGVAVMQVFPMAVIKRAVPIWSLPLNWIIGESASERTRRHTSELIIPTPQSRSETLSARSSSPPSSPSVRAPVSARGAG